MLLIISPTTISTGNRTTVTRLFSHFKKAEFYVEFCSPLDFYKETTCLLQSLNEYVAENKIDGVLILHAVKSGKLLYCTCQQNCKINFKYGVIFGGTDLNVDVTDDLKSNIMQSCLKRSQFNICFTSNLFEKSICLHPKGNNFVFPQAVDYDLFKRVDLPSPQSSFKPLIFVLPSSIRAVKDPMFLLDIFTELRSQLKLDIRLLIVGPVLDKEYHQTFISKIDSILSSQKSQKANFKVFGGNFHSYKKDMKKEISKLDPFPPISSSNHDSLTSWTLDQYGSYIQFIPAIKPHIFLNFLINGIFFAMINTSLSEGMSSAILESMTIGVPVLARDVPGNSAVITQQKTGILFRTPRQFLNHCMLLIEDKDYRDSLISNAKESIKKFHNPNNEAIFYVDLVKNKLFS